MDCGTSMVKYILFLFNTLCSIAGILLVIYGVLLLNDMDQYRSVEQNLEAHQIPLGLIILGSVILLLGFLGCCGAIRESYCMSMTYAVLLLMLIIVQLVCVVLVWINKDIFERSAVKIVDRAWEERTRDVGLMDALQIGFKCCGVNGPQDYLTSFKLPSSCCPSNECSVVPPNVYTTGCRSGMIEFWSGKNDIIKYAGLGVLAIEAVGFIFGCILANNIRNYKRRAAY